MQRIAVSILNHGGPGPTVRCVHSLLAEAQHAIGRFELAVWVADNGSDVQERRDLQSALAGLPAVTLRLHGSNLGFAAGHNRNLEAIFTAGKPDHLWLLNNDCAVTAGCIEALLSCAEKNPTVGIWGATLLEGDGRTIQCAGGCFYNFWVSSYRQYGKGKPASRRSELKNVEFSYVSGASLFLPVSTLESGLLPPARLGPSGFSAHSEYLNESFFLYFEEIDLAQRLKPGLVMGWCREALITHAGGESTGAGGGQRSAQAEYHSTLSALKFTRLYFPNRLWFTAPARLLAKTLQLLFTGNIRLLGSVTSAYRDFWQWHRAAGG
ncbi:glycosyltransferase [Pseudomonadota bacterium]